MKTTIPPLVFRMSLVPDFSMIGSIPGGVQYLVILAWIVFGIKRFFLIIPRSEKKNKKTHTHREKQLLKHILRSLLFDTDNPIAVPQFKSFRLKILRNGNAILLLYSQSIYHRHLMVSNKTQTSAVKYDQQSYTNIEGCHWRKSGMIVYNNAIGYWLSSINTRLTKINK